MKINKITLKQLLFIISIIMIKRNLQSSTDQIYLPCNQFINDQTNIQNKFAFSSNNYPNLNFQPDQSYCNNFDTLEIFIVGSTNHSICDIQSIILENICDQNSFSINISILGIEESAFQDQTITDDKITLQPTIQYSLINTNLQITGFNLITINKITFKNYDNNNIQLNNIIQINFNQLKLTDSTNSIINIKNSKIIFLENLEIKNNSNDGDIGVLSIDNCSNLSIINTQFLQNQVFGENSTIVLLQNIQGQLLIQDTDFQDNTSQLNGTLNLFYTEQIIIDNCNFSNNQALLGASIQIKYLKDVQIRNSRFQNNQCDSKEDCGLIIDNKETEVEGLNIELNNLTFQNNHGQQFSSLIIKNVKDQNNTQKGNIIISQINFIDNSAFIKQGGAFGLLNNNVNTVLQNSQFSNNFAKLQGGSISILDVENLLLDNLDIQNSSCQGDGGSIAIIGQNNNIILQNILVNNSTSENLGAGIYINNGQNYNLNNITVQNSQGNHGIGVTIISSTDIIFQNSLMQYNSGFQAGGISIQSCQHLNFINNTIQYNYITNRYGGVYLSASQNLLFKDNKIIHNQADIIAGGLALVDVNDSIFKYTLIKNNTSFDDYAGILISQAKNVLFDYLKLIENLAVKSGGGMHVRYVDNFNFTNLEGIGNICQKANGGAISMDSNDNMVYQNITLHDNTGLNAPGMYMVNSNNVFFQNMTVYNNIADNQSGGINIQESSDVKFYLLNIFNNKCQLQAGGFFISAIKNLLIDQMQLYQNVAEIGDGGALFITGLVENIQIQNSNIYNNIALLRGGGIFASDILNIQISNTTFSNNTATIEGASCYFFETQQIDFENSIFDNHKQNVQKGSCISVNKIQKISIISSNFTNNEATQSGGSIHIISTDEIKFENNNFTNNQVSQDQASYGGAVYVLNTGKFDCINNIFKQNFAKIQGGSIFLQNIAQTYLQDNIFSENIVQFDVNMQLEQKIQTYLITQGGGIYYEFKNYQYFEESQYKLLLNVQNNEFDKCQASSGSGIMINLNFQDLVTIFIEDNNFTDNIADIGPSIRVIGQNTDLVIDQQSQNNNIGLLHQDNIYQGYYTNEKLLDEKYSQYGLCEQGQQLQQGGILICEQCNSNGICKGGYISMYPNQGYWRFEKQSIDFYLCKNNQDACLGNDLCEEGYIGLLCEQCDQSLGYQKEGNFCKKCADNYLVWIQFVIVFLLFSIILGMQIYNLSKRIKVQQQQKFIKICFDQYYSKDNHIPGITKIFLMHIQLLYITIQGSFEIPSGLFAPVLALSNPQMYFSTNLNCLNTTKNTEMNSETIQHDISLISLIVTAGTFVLVLIIETFMHLCTKKAQKLSNILIGTLSSFFLLVQPGILQNSLNFILCRNLGDIQFTLADPNVICQSDYFNNTIFPINFVVVIFFGFLIPLMYGYILFKNNKNNKLQFQQPKQRYGVMYMEVKKKYYFWELVAIVIKVTVVIVSSVFQQDPILKGILCSIILIFYLLFCFNFQPYTTVHLNRLSQMSIITVFFCILTFITQIQFNQGNNDNSFEFIKFILIILIIGLNGIFFLQSIVLLQKETIYLIKRFFFLHQFFLKTKMGKYFIKKQLLEKKVVLIWRSIKIGVHHAIIAKKKYQKIHISGQKLLTEYIKKSLKEGKDSNYLQFEEIEKIAKVNQDIRERFPSFAIAPDQTEDFQNQILIQNNINKSNIIPTTDDTNLNIKNILEKKRQSKQTQPTKRTNQSLLVIQSQQKHDFSIKSPETKTQLDVSSQFDNIEQLSLSQREKSFTDLNTSTRSKNNSLIKRKRQPYKQKVRESKYKKSQLNNQNDQQFDQSLDQSNISQIYLNPSGSPYQNSMRDKNPSLCHSVDMNLINSNRKGDKNDEIIFDNY